jgi:phosphate-starvation-inducible protein E
MSSSARKPWPLVGAHYLNRSESAVLIAVGGVLVVVALMLLANSVIDVVNDAHLFFVPIPDVKPPGYKGPDNTAVDILNTVLLVMMTMEIVYTVAVSLESHTLVAEPFLIIGAISAIRRMLVITATSTQASPDEFRSTLLELLLLTLIVIAMAFAIWILKKAQAVVVPSTPSAEHSGGEHAESQHGKHADAGS